MYWVRVEVLNKVSEWLDDLDSIPDKRMIFLFANMSRRLQVTPTLLFCEYRGLFQPR
jgi:hypothetical protein